MNRTSRLVLLLLCCQLLERSSGFATVSSRINSLSPRFTATADNPSVDTSNDATGTQPDDDFPSPEDRTYYDILGAPPTATRTELKRQYVIMARLTHPDALIGKDEPGDNDRSAEFSEIAQAWKILSDEKERRRYDRSLKAEDFKKNVEVAATEFSKTAVPQVKRVLDDFAVPFLRRTTLTTVATVSAAVDRLSTGNGDIGSAFSSAFRAGEAASRVVDSIESREKSAELDLLATAELEKAEALKAKLIDVVERRWQKSLSTPHAALSSSEALTLLEGLDPEDSVSYAGRLMKMKDTIERNIHDLEEVEMTFYDKVAERTKAVDEFRSTQVELKRAAREAKDAVQQEVDARKALEDAQNQVVETRQKVSEMTKAFTKIQTAEGKVTREVEAIAENMSKRQENVRKALRRKKHEIALARRKKAGEVILDSNLPPEVDDPAILEEIEALRKEERYLAAEYVRREEKIARLISRAKRLKTQAEESEFLGEGKEVKPLAEASVSKPEESEASSSNGKVALEKEIEDLDVMIITEPASDPSPEQNRAKGFAPTSGKKKKKKP